jgi:hypothetical protein
MTSSLEGLPYVLCAVLQFSSTRSMRLPRRQLQAGDQSMGKAPHHGQVWAPL